MNPGACLCVTHQYTNTHTSFCTLNEPVNAAEKLAHMFIWVKEFPLKSNTAESLHFILISDVSSDSLCLRFIYVLFRMFCIFYTIHTGVVCCRYSIISMFG